MAFLDAKKVVLGMSGGVDSSVAALLLRQQGYEVFGVSMQLYSCDRPLARGCCTPLDRLDARKVCEQLKIPFDVVDLRGVFKEVVVDYFAKEYGEGRTPLPCVPCNKEVRFKALLDRADQIGAKWIATGHYARVMKNEDGSFCLLKGVESKKDQSYFLWSLEEEALSRLQLPVGSLTKLQVREIAKAHRLPTSEKEESQDLCFVGEEGAPSFLEEHYPLNVFGAGDFVDESGKKLGRHHGLHCYTVGQRRGLGIGFSERRYVLRLDAQKNEVVLGTRDQLKASGAVLRKSGSVEVLKCRSLQVKIRSTHPGVGVLVAPVKDPFTIIFDKPQEAVTPGQAAVFYNGDCCLGGAWIERALP